MSPRRNPSDKPAEPVNALSQAQENQPLSEITRAIAARQTQITQLQSEIATLQHAASIVGGGTKASARATPKAKPKAKATPRKRQAMSAAQKKAVSKRMKAYWAKRQKPTAATATAPAQPKATQKRTRKSWSAAAKKAMSKRIKASWAKRRKAKG